MNGTSAPGEIARHVYLSSTVPLADGSGTFSPVTSVLFTGTTDAVLIDAQHMSDDVEALGDMIENTGKRLTSIFVTHAHGDHYFGIDMLLRRFPGARALATERVVAEITRTHLESVKRWRHLFTDRVAPCNVAPQPLQGDLPLEDSMIRVIEVDQSDISPSTVLYEPRTATVVPADLLYNRIHVMLGLSNPDGWKKWLRNIDMVEQLQPRSIICGHKQPEASDNEPGRIIDETRRYIRSFAEEVGRAPNAAALVQAMTDRFPDFGNPWTLHFSARAAMAGAQAG